MSSFQKVLLFTKVQIFIFAFVISSSDGIKFLQEGKSASHDVTFVIYNRNNSNGIKLKLEENERLSSYFVEGLPCVFITHGWIRSIDTPSVQDPVQAHLRKKKDNVIAVDWRHQANGIYPLVAEEEVPKVGSIVGSMLLKLFRLRFCSINNTHLIGHSLGAHVMGIAAQKVFAETGVKIGRITGLDPAGPLFEQNLTSKESRLKADDALCVDVIHSDGGKLGYKSRIGKTDFYPNGGSDQPGCSFIQFFCSHRRAFMLYAESVDNPEAFPSKQSGSYRDYQDQHCSENPTVYMGYPADCKIQGDFYLTTRDSSPYSTTNDVND